MAVLLLQIALPLIVAGAQPQVADPGPSKEALFGWPWGTPRETIAREQQLEPLPSTEAGVRRYRTELSSFGDAVLWDCEFEFVHDRFAGIAITTRGKANSHALLRELRRLFGPGQEEDPRGVGWLTPTTHAHYDEDSAGDAYVYIYALRIQPVPGAATPARSH